LIRDKIPKEYPQPHAGLRVFFYPLLHKKGVVAPIYRLALLQRDIDGCFANTRK
jgi:hypothetical protein